LFFGLQNALERKEATVFGYYVNDPQRYGVIEFNENREVISLEEKPKIAKSNYAITGLYFYPNNVVKKASKVKPSNRGELEITTINEMYLSEGLLKVEILGRGYTWLDTGTPESFLEASMFIEALENRQGLKVACLEEIAFQKEYISKSQLLALAKPLVKTKYGQYLLRIANQNIKN
jgi:glucose-1-phosphate thymidylyltransferase